jgi:hypothetical protein
MFLPSQSDVQIHSQVFRLWNVGIVYHYRDLYILPVSKVNMY